ncbi:MAG: lysine--tRNA ligase [Candidatus Omnitrophica bacterium]|nr:lysine--tRNA ligase [Candidatus Omnitrophota bacterium]
MSQEEIYQQRMASRTFLQAENLEPYGRAFARTPAKEITEGEKDVSAAGRVMAFRRHGRTSFLDLQDESGKIQLYVKRESLDGESAKFFDNLDIGDIAGAVGDTFRTKTGELTIAVRSLKILAKSLRPLPEKWHGLKDVETRYRCRELDLIMNQEVRDVFRKRSRLVELLRQFLTSRGFLEVETPMMHLLPGGAEARPFVTYHHTLGLNLYLRIAPELYLKRLLVGGFEKVFEINRSFRNEGISTLHNPEFTMLEAYSAFSDCQGMMELVEELINSCVTSLLGTEEISYQKERVNFSRPWKRIRWAEAFQQLGLDWRDEKQVQEKAESISSEEKDGLPRTHFDRLDAIFKKEIQPLLVQPTFVIEYPRAISPLAKCVPGSPEMTERFELFVAGLEIANAYSELNDPVEQRERFEEQISRQTPDRPKELDLTYVTALEFGMPPAGGLGIGIDRLTMILTDNSSIREVILFPLLRPR